MLIGLGVAENITNISLLKLIALFFSYVLFRAIFLQGGLYILLEKFNFRKNKRIFKINFKKKQLRKELISNIQTIFFDATTLAVLVKFGPQISAEGNVLITFLVSFIWFEVWFYTSHRLLHSKLLYFIHQQHHVAQVTSPLTALSFSVLERAILVLGGIIPLILVSKLLSLSFIGIALYFFVNYILNIYGHSNIEIVPPRWIQRPLGRILNTSTYHALHHARYSGHYGLFTPFMDRLFSTDFRDYKTVQRLAFNGQGLEKLNTQPLAPVVVITGASSGIGEALAREYYLNGYRVAILARRLDRLNDIANSLGPNCLAIEADVTQRRTLDLAFNLVINKFGKVDIVIANAGAASRKW